MKHSGCVPTATGAGSRRYVPEMSAEGNRQADDTLAFFVAGEDPREDLTHRVPGPAHIAGAEELMRQGFIALDVVWCLTGMWREWPETHRCSLPETRTELLDDDSPEGDAAEVWFLRSPWPSVGMDQVVRHLHGRVTAQMERNPELAMRLVREVLERDDATMLRRTQGHRPRRLSASDAAGR